MILAIIAFTNLRFSVMVANGLLSILRIQQQQGVAIPTITNRWNDAVLMSVRRLRHRTANKPAHGHRLVLSTDS